MFTQDVEDNMDVGGPSPKPEGKKTGNFTPTTSTGPPPTATTGNGNDPPDAALVNERLALMRECKTQEEHNDWSRATAMPDVKNKLTEAGRKHINAMAKEYFATLPKAVTVNEDSEPPIDPSIPY